MSYALLEKACTRCKPSSIKTYWANIKALARLAGHGEKMPAGPRWLSDGLLKRVRSMPLNRYKRYSTAGVKAAQMYKAKRPRWSKAMSDSTEKYARIRESGKRTQREHENWPKDGYRALGDLAQKLHSEMDLEEKKTWSRGDLYRYQKYLIVLFYSKHALRGDLADVRYKKPLGSKGRASGKGYKLHIGEHKTARAHGAIQIDLGPAVSRPGHLPATPQETNESRLPPDDPALGQPIAAAGHVAPDSKHNQREAGQEHRGPADTRAQGERERRRD